MKIFATPDYLQQGYSIKTFKPGNNSPSAASSFLLDFVSMKRRVDIAIAVMIIVTIRNLRALTRQYIH